MGEIVRNESGVSQDNIDEPSIFDGLKPKPVYYSESAIYWYSTILGILFGGVLMAINCSNTEGKRGAWQVVVFSVLFMAIETVLFNYIIREYKWLHFVFNIAGAFILNQVFWEEYIGKNVVYVRRSTLIPTIVSLVIVVALIVANIVLKAGK